MIKYNDNTINKWYHDGELIKVYYHDAVCYYKLTPSGQTPCFAVVASISQYTDREFEDVFNQADGKWYKLNNLNAYEEYGVYGSGRTITYYEGKLTIDGDYEYIYSGSSWQNLGEVSGSTATLPNVPFSLNYNAKEYDTSTNKIPQTSGQLQNVDAIQTYGNGVVDHSADGYISITGNTRFVCSGNSGTYLNRRNTQAECTMTIISKAKTTNGYSILTNRQGNGVRHLNWMYRQYAEGYMKLHGQSADLQIACSTTEPNILVARTYYDNGVKYYLNNWSSGTTSSIASFAYLNTASAGGALFCDYSDVNSEFWQGDFYWIYMSQNALTDEQVQQVIAYNEGGTVEYPMYYDEIQDPPDNVSFSSMTEAEEYECPWVGMIAIIDGVKYIFSGDSQSGYEWVAKPSRLPQGYTEVEYVENDSLAYIDTGFKPNQDTRILCKMQVVTSTSYNPHFGCGSWDTYNDIRMGYETGINGTLHVKYGTNNGWTVYSNVTGDYSVHTYDWNKNEFYRDGSFIGSVTYGNFQSTYNLGIFYVIQNGSPTSTYICYGRAYSFKIYDDGTLVRDFVPCTRDSDSKVGVYDIVNDVFYQSANSNSLIAGPTV